MFFHLRFLWVFATELFCFGSEKDGKKLDLVFYYVFQCSMENHHPKVDIALVFVGRKASNFNLLQRLLYGLLAGSLAV